MMNLEIGEDLRGHRRHPHPDRRPEHHRHRRLLSGDTAPTMKRCSGMTSSAPLRGPGARAQPGQYRRSRPRHARLRLPRAAGGQRVPRPAGSGKVRRRRLRRHRLNATSYATLADAVADCTLVLGTTAVGERELRHHLLAPLTTPPRASTRSPRLPAARRVALLFGSEKTGLSNEESSFCHWLLTIPMYQHPGLRHPSMNLGQAVAVCLWSLCAPTLPHRDPTTLIRDSRRLRRARSGCTRC